MPLNPVQLQSAIESMSSDPPDTVAECAESWASAMGSYAAAIVPASLAVTAAQAALQTQLTSAFSAAPGSGAALVDAAFTVFAGAVAGGMAPAFVAVPPVSPPGFASQATGTAPATHSAAATLLANMIDTWLRTGLATPAAGGPAVPFS